MNAPKLHPTKTIVFAVDKVLTGRCSERLPNTLEVQQVTQKPIKTAPAAATKRLLENRTVNRPAIPINMDTGSKRCFSFFVIVPKTSPARNPANVEILIMVEPSAADPMPVSSKKLEIRRERETLVDTIKNPRNALPRMKGISFAVSLAVSSKSAKSGVISDSLLGTNKR